MADDAINGKFVLRWASAIQTKIGYRRPMASKYNAGCHLIRCRARDEGMQLPFGILAHGRTLAARSHVRIHRGPDSSGARISGHGTTFDMAASLTRSPHDRPRVRWTPKTGRPDKV